MDTVCEQSISHPHEADDASHLRFFTEIVTRLEDRATRARELVEEISQGLLRRVFSCVFGHLLNLDTHFDFDDVIAPMPGSSKITQRAGWSTMWMTWSWSSLPRIAWS